MSAHPMEKVCKNFQPPLIRRHPVLGVAALALGAWAAYTLVMSTPDIVRYVKIKMM